MIKCAKTIVKLLLVHSLLFSSAQAMELVRTWGEQITQKATKRGEAPFSSAKKNVGQQGTSSRSHLPNRSPPFGSSCSFDRFYLSSINRYPCDISKAIEFAETNQDDVERRLKKESLLENEGPLSPETKIEITNALISVYNVHGRINPTPLLPETIYELTKLFYLMTKGK